MNDRTHFQFLVALCGYGLQCIAMIWFAYFLSSPFIFSILDYSHWIQYCMAFLAFAFPFTFGLAGVAGIYYVLQDWEDCHSLRCYRKARATAKQKALRLY